MRIILILLLALPFSLHAQINRSYNELAEENIHSYLSKKIFNGAPYKIVTYGSVKAVRNKDSDVNWKVHYKIEENSSKKSGETRPDNTPTFNYCFYLDKELRVLFMEKDI